MYIICMNYMYTNQPSLKPVTLYMMSKLYETYQIEAQKKGKKASELIREAMEDYAQRNFFQKKSMTQLNLSRTVKSGNNQKDFISDYKNDFMDSQTNLLIGDNPEN